ncbi:restriction endonuclease subunit S [Mycoplasma tullyi]|uniref:restriction endonuclease subunit S n=1 Tax=Mycoplasma tullyi TaxID=1612150 RepID=UPI001E470229|nr:restriction endonuclease subunit S [Mycoplasma tullyi]
MFDQVNVKLSDIATIKTGSRITKKQLLKQGYPVISGGMNIFGYYDQFNTKANTITIAKYGTAGYIDFQTQEFWANDVTYLIEPLEFIDNKFLYYTLLNNQKLIDSYVIKATPNHLPIDKLKELPITITSFKNQEVISKWIDSFNNLIIDMDNSIPKLIELSTKQYIYYRNYLFGLLENK